MGDIATNFPIHRRFQEAVSLARSIVPQTTTNIETVVVVSNDKGEPGVAIILEDFSWEEFRVICFKNMDLKTKIVLICDTVERAKSLAKDWIETYQGLVV